MTDKKPLWRNLVKAEPMLGQLLKEARATKDPGTTRSFCANAIWRREFRPRLLDLVGWGRMGHPVLGTSAAYEVAYKKVYQALPNCRNCSCL